MEKIRFLPSGKSSRYKSLQKSLSFAILPPIISIYFDLSGIKIFFLKNSNISSSSGLSELNNLSVIFDLCPLQK